MLAARKAASPFTRQEMPIYDAADAYIADGTPTVVFGGESMEPVHRATGRRKARSFSA